MKFSFFITPRSSGTSSISRSAVFFVAAGVSRVRDFCGRNGGRSIAYPGCTSGEPTAMRGSVGCKSPSSTIMTYMWANTSSMNRFPHEQGCPYSREGRGARLSSVRMLHSEQGRKMAGSEGNDFFCGLHAVHPAYGTLHAASYACPIIQRFSNAITREAHGNGKYYEKRRGSGPEGIRTHDRPVMSRAL